MNTREKILAHAELRARIEERRQAGQRIVLANGIFDVLHVGHARYLQGAKGEGEVLVVAVNSDESAARWKGPGRPVLGVEARAQLVAALAAVDYVTVFDEPNVEPLLEALRPHVHAKGTDYTAETVPERAAAQRIGARVAIVGDAKQHSTTGLIHQVRRRDA